jgi:hypothetical protein
MMRIVLADEISPDNRAGCGTSRPARSSTRTASAATSGGKVEAYQEVARRLGIASRS